MSEKTVTDRQKRSILLKHRPDGESVLRRTFAALQGRPGNGKATEAALQTSYEFERSGRGLQNERAASIESAQTRGCPNWRCGYDFSQVPARSARTQSRHTVQASLTVNPPGDRYEQEADRVAADVMSAPRSSVQLTPT